MDHSLSGMQPLQSVSSLGLGAGTDIPLSPQWKLGNAAKPPEAAAKSALVGPWTDGTAPAAPAAAKPWRAGEDKTSNVLATPALTTRAAPTVAASNTRWREEDRQHDRWGAGAVQDGHRNAGPAQPSDRWAAGHIPSIGGVGGTGISGGGSTGTVLVGGPVGGPPLVDGAISGAKFEPKFDAAGRGRGRPVEEHKEHSRWGAPAAGVAKEHAHNEWTVGGGNGVGSELQDTAAKRAAADRWGNGAPVGVVEPFRPASHALGHAAGGLAGHASNAHVQTGLPGDRWRGSTGVFTAAPGTGEILARVPGRGQGFAAGRGRGLKGPTVPGAPGAVDRWGPSTPGSVSGGGSVLDSRHAIGGGGGAGNSERHVRYTPPYLQRVYDDLLSGVPNGRHLPVPPGVDTVVFDMYPELQTAQTGHDTPFQPSKPPDGADSHLPVTGGAGENGHTAAPVPAHAFAHDMWLYRDPHGAVQGPFPKVDIVEWFEAGFFPQELPIKAAMEPEDAAFIPLSSMLKMWAHIGAGRAPPGFAPHTAHGQATPTAATAEQPQQQQQPQQQKPVQQQQSMQQQQQPQASAAVPAPARSSLLETLLGKTLIDDPSRSPPSSSDMSSVSHNNNSTLLLNANNGNANPIGNGLAPSGQLLNQPMNSLNQPLDSLSQSLHGPQMSGSFSNALSNAFTLDVSNLSLGGSSNHLGGSSSQLANFDRSNNLPSPRMGGPQPNQFYAQPQQQHQQQQHHPLSQQQQPQQQQQLGFQQTPQPHQHHQAQEASPSPQGLGSASPAAFQFNSWLRGGQEMHTPQMFAPKLRPEGDSATFSSWNAQTPSEHAPTPQHLQQQQQGRGMFGGGTIPNTPFSQVSGGGVLNASTSSTVSIGKTIPDIEHRYAQLGVLSLQQQTQAAQAQPPQQPQLGGLGSHLPHPQQQQQQQQHSQAHLQQQQHPNELLQRLAVEQQAAQHQHFMQQQHMLHLNQQAQAQALAQRHAQEALGLQAPAAGSAWGPPPPTGGQPGGGTLAHPGRTLADIQREQSEEAARTAALHVQQQAQLQQQQLAQQQQLQAQHSFEAEAAAAKAAAAAAAANEAATLQRQLQLQQYKDMMARAAAATESAAPPPAKAEDAAVSTQRAKEEQQEAEAATAAAAATSAAAAQPAKAAPWAATATNKTPPGMSLRDIQQEEARVAALAAARAAAAASAAGGPEASSTSQTDKTSPWAKIAAANAHITQPPPWNPPAQAAAAAAAPTPAPAQDTRPVGTGPGPRGSTLAELLERKLQPAIAPPPPPPVWGGNITAHRANAPNLRTVMYEESAWDLEGGDLDEDLSDVLPPPLQPPPPPPAQANGGWGGAMPPTARTLREVQAEEEARAKARAPPPQAKPAKQAQQTAAADADGDLFWDYGQATVPAAPAPAPMQRQQQSQQQTVASLLRPGAAVIAAARPTAVPGAGKWNAAPAAVTAAPRAAAAAGPPPAAVRANGGNTAAPAQRPAPAAQQQTAVVASRGTATPSSMTPSPSASDLAALGGASGQGTAASFTPEFASWCRSKMAGFFGSEELTFVEFLMGLSSRSEVADYCQMYLSDRQGVSTFVAEFLKRKDAELAQRTKGRKKRAGGGGIDAQPTMAAIAKAAAPAAGARAVAQPAGRAGGSSTALAAAPAAGSGSGSDWQQIPAVAKAAAPGKKSGAAKGKKDVKGSGVFGVLGNE